VQKRPLIWFLFPSYLLVTVAALLTVTMYAARAIDSFYEEHITRDLGVRAHVVSHRFRGLLESADPAAIDRLCDLLGGEIDTRISVILPDGGVAGDSEKHPDAMENHADRPEIIEARETGRGHSTRFSSTLKREMIYNAVSITDENGAPLGVVRVAVPLTTIRDASWSVHTRIMLSGIIVSLLAAVVSWKVARRISRPLREMRMGAERFARGDFSRQLDVPGSLEIGGLAEAMNQMARQLDDRIRTVISQRNQQEAILSSMVEGVLAVDTARKIISLNDAAAQLLGLQPELVLDRSFDTAVENDQLKRFLGQVLESQEPAENEFVLDSSDGRILQVHGTVLRDSQGKGIGAVIVLNDVTRLRRLEEVRRDFVANVSHELRTPITSIKGFVETLLDGAMDNPGDARHFLEIVMKQADRLNAILGDLLTLSRIEEGEEKSGIELQKAGIRDVLQSAIQLCENRAARKNIRLRLDCGAGLSGPINASLLEQAVTNLVDNAIKYSEHDEEVRVSGRRSNGEIILRVADHGCGIPEDHLPRLFERFYRVDKARSRHMGGTGLGLSIVKHIARTHSGRVSVESTPGVGSVFSIHLPAG
jgi:two-component system, OmpR family, phosphate regulon sensor histidine kinase PhoR